MPTKKVYELICQEWEESERGWGARPDGYTLHLTKEARDRYVAWWLEEERKFAADNPGVPDECSRLSGEPFRVRVTKKLYDKVMKSEEKYIWGEGNTCPYERMV